ncbi:MAG: Asp23/Gls24 family envelope stress response protein [Thermovirgaceae bacterium]
MSPSRKEPDKEIPVDSTVGSPAEPGNDPGLSEEKSEGSVRISEEVIAQIATQALLKVNGVQPASPGLVANLRLGKKTSGGVRISVEEGDMPSVVVDAYITTKYGLRIPDIAWDVQESIKKTLEQYTGYVVKAVNVFVQGVFFEHEQTTFKEPVEEKKEAE